MTKKYTKKQISEAIKYWRKKLAIMNEDGPSIRVMSAIRQNNSSSLFEKQLRKFDQSFTVRAIAWGDIPYFPVKKNGKIWFERDRHGRPYAAVHLDAKGEKTTVKDFLRDWTKFAAGEDLYVQAVADGEVLNFTMARTGNEPGIVDIYFAPPLPY